VVERVDVYFKKEVTYRNSGHVLRLRVSQDLFSSHQVDVGTSFLLRTLGDARYGPFDKILDLGCGYGPLGLTLKKMNEDSVVHMVDRDALAVEYSRQNAELNGISDAEVYGSLGYDDVRAEDFDLIACNIPGKAGERAISHLLRDAADYLRPAGMVAVVVVTPLEGVVEQVLTGTPGIDIIFRGARSGHAVFHYRSTGDGGGADGGRVSGLERGVYDRMRETFSAGGLEYPMQAARGLPEFDSLGYKTQLLMEEMGNIRDSAIESALVFNPGQGHIPVVLWKLIKPKKMILVDRDLLALRFSRNNLAMNQCPDESIILSHQVGVSTKEPEQVDLVVGVLREEEGTEPAALTVQQGAEQLSPQGVLLVSASSTAVARLTRALGSGDLPRLKRRRKRRGNAVLVLEPS